MSDDFPDQHGRRYLVTGATGGIGAAAGRALSTAGAEVVLAVRDLDRGAAVAATFPGPTEVLVLDVSRLDSVRAFARDWSGRLDGLLNNAGVMATPFARTPDGFESQLATNFLGHFALTRLLLPSVTDRIVNVSSVLASFARIDLDDLNWQRRRYRPWRAYGQSKLADLLITDELQRRLDLVGSRVRAVTAHPGVARTGLYGNGNATGAMGVVLRGAARWRGVSPEIGARSVLQALTADVAGGSYLAPPSRPSVVREQRRARHEDDHATALALWERASALTGFSAAL